ncbi:PTS sugar transporter subunit IIA, partial [Eubacterium aggregans]|uniref:PTS sugar transporter subunit IIA n=1 Tax=Eubacterium aggregans TaxID=81409 RepID=UPI003F3DA13E
SHLEDFLETPLADQLEIDNLKASGPVPPEPQEQTVSEKTGLVETFIAPISGRLVPIEETQDEVFSQKMMGDGVVIFPKGHQVYAPCSGIISVFFPTKHAIGITSDHGTELLIHVGIDTVKLDGKGFEGHIEQGQHVEAGDLLLILDLDFLEANVPSTAIPIIFTDLPATKEMEIITTGEIKDKEDIVKINS